MRWCAGGRSWWSGDGTAGAWRVACGAQALARGVKVGPTYFIPNFQIGSFGGITPISSLLKVRGAQGVACMPASTRRALQLRPGAAPWRGENWRALAGRCFARARARLQDRTQLWDVAAAGPLAGVLFSVALLAVGLSQSQPGALPAEALVRQATCGSRAWRRGLPLARVGGSCGPVAQAGGQRDAHHRPRRLLVRRVRAVVAQVPVPTPLFQGSLLLGGITRIALGETALRAAEVRIGTKPTRLNLKRRASRTLRASSPVFSGPWWLYLVLALCRMCITSCRCLCRRW